MVANDKVLASALPSDIPPEATPAPCATVVILPIAVVAEMELLPVSPTADPVSAAIVFNWLSCPLAVDDDINLSLQRLTWVS